MTLELMKIVPPECVIMVKEYNIDINGTKYLCFIHFNQSPIAVNFAYSFFFQSESKTSRNKTQLASWQRRLLKRTLWMS